MRYLPPDPLPKGKGRIFDSYRWSPRFLRHFFPFLFEKGAGGFGLLLLISILLTACSTASTATTAATVSSPLLTYQWLDIALLEPSWLRDHINTPDIRIVDVSDHPRYLLGHVPGAVHAYWEDLVELHVYTYGQLAEGSVREKTFGNLGIGQDTLVVVYDRTDNRAAARFAWALWYAGHPNVRILNGGLAGWTAAGYALERQIHTAPPVFYRDLPDESVHINRCDVFKATTDPQAIILDVRTDAEMTQTWENTMQIGSIPNARRLPWTAFIHDPNLPAFRSPDELRAMLARVGATPDRNIAVYGTFSNDAALPFFALKALGYVHVKLYDGGWAEWGANPTFANLGPPCPPGA